MKSVIKRSLFSLGALVVSVTGLSQKGTAYEYVPSTDSYEYSSATPEERTDAHWWDASASADADESTGDCSCGVHTYTWAKEDSAVAEADADGAYSKDWDWNGPPGTAPGGTLSWSHDGQGFSSAYGHNWPNQGGAFSVANADSETCAQTSSTASYAWGNASGYVTDGGAPTASEAAGGSPEPYYVDPHWDYDWGMFDYSVEWAVWDEGDDPIASGTSHIDYAGGASCYSYSGASGGPSESGAEAKAVTYGAALVRAEASLNP